MSTDDNTPCQFQTWGMIRTIVIAREAVRRLGESVRRAGSDTAGNETLYRALKAAEAVAKAEMHDGYVALGDAMRAGALVPTDFDWRGVPMPVNEILDMCGAATTFSDAAYLLENGYPND